MGSQAEENVITRVQNTIETYQMFKGITTCVIAFSSGPDSVCVLDVIHTLYRDRIKLHIVYVNHGLRSDKALKQEEKLVRQYSARYNIPHAIVKISVRKQKIGLEAAAREKRYQVLQQYMRLHSDLC